MRAGTDAGCGRRALFAVLLASAAAVIVRAAPLRAADDLTGVARLKAAYDEILNAQPERAAGLLLTACGPAPDEACAVMQATALWWQILLDPLSRKLDTEFVRTVDAAITACERWVDREPERAEAWFYLGAAYGARVSWRVERGERMAAARDGKRIKESLEHALEIDPSMADARFGIGLYKYYADVAPAAARFLRFLLLLPGGDKRAGLADMQMASAEGQLVAGEADYQLHWIYLWYENEPQQALELLERLHARYPANPHFLQRIAEVRAEYLHDPAASLAAWRKLATTAARSGAPLIAEVQGRLGTAEQLDVLFETDRSIEELTRIVALHPAAPVGAEARAHLLLGQARDRLGERAAAVTSYRAALNVLPHGDPDDVGEAARKGLRRAGDPRLAAAYRTSLAGWRLFERGRLDEAADRLSTALTLAPDDGMIRARLGRVQAARREYTAALLELDRVLSMDHTASPIALGSAYLWSAEVHERGGNRAEAIERYKSVERVFGTDSRLVAQAARALKRLRSN